MRADVAGAFERDVFISHAWEDKEEIARPLARALQARGCSVWFDEFELVLGDSLRKRLSAGLRLSRVGVVIVSRSFFAKRWTQWELDGLTARQIAGEANVLLPVWHDLNPEEVRSYSPPLADLVAARTSDGVTVVADEVLRVLRRLPETPEALPHVVRAPSLGGKQLRSSQTPAERDPMPSSDADSSAPTRRPGRPCNRFALNSEEPTVKAIEWLTPIGRGSRATLVGAAGAGKSTALRRLAVAMKQVPAARPLVALAGPAVYEMSSWEDDGLAPMVLIAPGATADAQRAAIARIHVAARTLMGRGRDVVVFFDTFDAVERSLAHQLFEATTPDEPGTITVIGVASAALGGETTLIAFDGELIRAGRFPGLDLTACQLREPERLVGENGAAAIREAYAEALKYRAP